MFLVVICENLISFVNTLTGDDKHFLRNNHNIQQPIQMNYLKKNLFLQFFGEFQKFAFNLKYLEKRPS